MKRNNLNIQQNFKPVATFDISLSGAFACFSDSVTKVERTCYPAPTAGALEYLIERIYGHPNIRYRINKVYILKPLKYYGMYVNERPAMGDVDCKTGEITCPENTLPMQRMTAYLRDVEYVVNFTMFYDKNYYSRNHLPVHAGENHIKHIDTLVRRIAAGQEHAEPVFGTSGCHADIDVAPKDFTPCKDINESYNSLYKIVHYNDSTNATAWTQVNIKNGVLDFAGSVIHFNGKEYTQDEFLNLDWRKSNVNIF